VADDGIRRFRRAVGRTAVTLVVVLAPACSDGTEGRTVATTVAAEPLRADFEFQIDYEETHTTSCPVTAIRFVDRSAGSPQGWRWQFPDGSVSQDQHPTVHGPLWGEVILTVSRGDESAETSRVVAPAEC
jgi:PKD repeat protein